MCAGLRVACRRRGVTFGVVRRWLMTDMLGFFAPGLYRLDRMVYCRRQRKSAARHQAKIGKRIGQSLLGVGRLKFSLI